MLDSNAKRLEGMAPPIRVVIADDHLLLRRGTREILHRDPRIEVVGEAADGEDALNLVERLHPDIVLMDVAMPGVNGLDATRRITDGSPATRVLLLTVHDEEEYVVEGIRSGASGYLLKDVDAEQLVEAVVTVAGGGAVLHPRLAPGVVRSLRDPNPAPTEVLTSRQAEVLALVAEGLSNREIGERLGTSGRTVEVHVSNILRRLDVSSRTEAVVQGIRRGLIDPGGPG